MEMIAHFRRQFAYDSWANGAVLSACRKASSEPSFTRALQLLSHIVSAERLWLERLQGHAQSLPVWPEFGMERCAAEIPALGSMWKDYLASLSDTTLDGRISYKNSKGEAWASSVQDVLTHVIMHSAYHRGQVASVIRDGGGVPAYTDFIHAARQGVIELSD